MKHLFGWWLLAALAVALAMLVGDNPGVVTLFWHPYRVDLSFNLVLFGLAALFLLGYLAWRGVALLRQLPLQAQRWRMHQLERSVHVSVADALAFQLAGRFVRARDAARRALNQLRQLPVDTFPHRDQLATLAHWLAAESAHALGDVSQRDHHLRQATSNRAAGAESAREGALLRAAGWAVEARDPDAAHRWLTELPQGAARRIQALRLRLKLARLQHNHPAALEMVRLLTKHRAFSPALSKSLWRALVLDGLRATHDSDQLLRFWQQLGGREQWSADLAMAMLDHWMALDDGPAAADFQHHPLPVRQLLHQTLQALWQEQSQLAPEQRLRLCGLLERAWIQLPASWLAEVESAQRAQPADAALQYLAGQACMQHQLWGKAQSLLAQAIQGLQDQVLRRRAWCSLARLAEQRGDVTEAQHAWKQAALA
jgi:HemY protein